MSPFFWAFLFLFGLSFFIFFLWPLFDSKLEQDMTLHECLRHFSMQIPRFAAHLAETIGSAVGLSGGPTGRCFATVESFKDAAEWEDVVDQGRTMCDTITRNACT